MPYRLHLVIRIRSEHGEPVRGTLIERRGGAVRYFGSLRDLRDLLALRADHRAAAPDTGHRPSEPLP
jgi:hypothetical protein